MISLSGFVCDRKRTTTDEQLKQKTCFEAPEPKSKHGRFRCGCFAIEPTAAIDGKFWACI